MSESILFSSDLSGKGDWLGEICGEKFDFDMINGKLMLFERMTVI